MYFCPSVPLGFVSGNICVPVDPTKVHEFDPTKVPNLKQLLDELDSLMEDDTDHSCETYRPWHLILVPHLIQLNVCLNRGFYDSMGEDFFAAICPDDGSACGRTDEGSTNGQPR